MKQWNPMPGDGIIHIPTDRPGVIVGRNTSDGYYGIPKGELVSVSVRFFKDQYPETVNVGLFRRETFFEHLTRPTGFGKTRWEAFAAIQAMLILFVAFGLRNWSEAGLWSVGTWVVVNAVLVLGTWMNYTRRWV